MAQTNIFARMGSGIVRFFREEKSEIKKIVWPTPAKITKDTSIVIAAVVIIGILMAVLGFVFKSGVAWLVGG